MGGTSTGNIHTSFLLFGLGYGQDDQRIGSIDDKVDADSPVLLGSFSEVGEVNVNVGLNYTLLWSDLRVIVGGGIDITYHGSYTNWYDSTEELGKNG
ncbi:hypothetical protein [Vibrio maritimus]|uniref:hypothetical protein n=1 Tax=Vibrio maritimus TaxID=990268 RepID=UPI001F2615A6|nr:hypothetical protein [Vibrio maritimus]